ncbi:AAA domain-containing protein, putative AbiEii toxin, Type IV TA system [Sphaerochaeta associata]|uniref:ATP-binding protein n=1 Tax=Sphaerochaeta associata TaxID=1129264 RepID=A0ABY4D9A1_9SPIR|nr:AAA family ATPase [Sphaerochaeta associata]UOM50422.1 ATP-binding protein [Sphaerochaeta associata]SMP41875.1 AAA domain-containing protein, putative AbiEii toxin, Type IV TA system [Sphaerochaeta associata]
MKAASVRLGGITIYNFKNVLEGSLSFINTRKTYKASIVGLYGQNGSGKTALIDALELLKYVLCGRTIPEKFAEYINVDSESATLVYQFIVTTSEESFIVSYQFSIQSAQDVSEQNINSIQSTEHRKRVRIYNELLKCPILGEKKIRIGKLIDTDTSQVFLPNPKRLLLIGNDRKIDTDLQVAKKLTSVQSRSFVFSSELLGAIRNVVSKSINSEKERFFYATIIESLVNFGNHELFIINTSNTGIISLNAQPLSFKFSGGKVGAIGSMMLPLNEPAVIPEKAKEVVTKVIQNMNVVLKQLVPDLTIHIKDLGTQVLENGEIGSRIQLMSRKDSKEIPLSYESEGIKKIISILQLLIVVYNQASITVAIDELDSGVFEYLLGELLSIISERGKGQLIFTSHNLRPLETLDRGFIAFTTTNPQNRYVRMINVKDNNNLRDFYFRDIMLGEQDEQLYEQTNNADIALSFREAGEYCGS